MKYGENLKIVEYLMDKTPYQKIEYYYEKELLIQADSNQSTKSSLVRAELEICL
jgi:hypothetical protein